MQNRSKIVGSWLAGSLLALVTACSSSPTPAPVAKDGDTGSEVSDAVADADATNALVDGLTDSTTGGPPDADDKDTLPSDDGSPNVTADTATADTNQPDIPPKDVPPVKVCNQGESKCAGAKLATCGVYEDGWIESSCFPGLTCDVKDGKGMCVPVSNNLIIAFDTSGSMNSKVPNCLKGTPSWPGCDPTKGCSRMDVSKVTFKKALQKIDDQVTRMALFRFPQKINFKKTKPSCTSGYYQGQSIISGETKPGPKDQEFVDDSPISKWFWQTLNETLCVEFPINGQAKTKQEILTWMNGTESFKWVGNCTPTSTILCNPTPGCAGSCCPAGSGLSKAGCYVHSDPEFRPTGGTPIGKTLYYVGEYLRNRVVIDGKACTTTTSCNNVNYECRQDGKLCSTAADGCTKGKCEDPARSCRDTTVVLFTDGGQGNSNKYFAPWMQAKRLGFGLGCKTDADCVGGAVCKELKGSSPKQMHCRRPTTITDWYCNPTMEPCLPNMNANDPLYCKQCVRDPLSYLSHGTWGKTCSSSAECALGELCGIPPGSGLSEKHCIGYKAPLTATAKNSADNVLRSPNGKPFGVRVFVVDISGAANLTNSMSLALAGNGKLLGADASDPDSFLKALDKAFDFKNLKVCGSTQ